MRNKLVKLICIVSCLWASGNALADGVAVSAKYQTASGGYRYYITLGNNTVEFPSRYVTNLNVTIPGPSELEHPPTWDAGATYVSAWWELAPPRPFPQDWYMQGIAPGGSLSGFNVTSPTLVERFWYQVFTRDGAVAPVYSGFAYPEPVPEPSALMALAGGLGALGLPMLRRRRWAASFRHRDPLV